MVRMAIATANHANVATNPYNASPAAMKNAPNAIISMGGRFSARRVIANCISTTMAALMLMIVP